MLDQVLTIIAQLNSNKLFAALALIFMNLGSRYVIADLNKIYENVLMMDFVKKFILFCIFFIGCRDIMIAIILTFTFSIIFQALFNAKSKYSLLPKALRAKINLTNKRVSIEDYKNAREVVEMYETKSLEAFSKVSDHQDPMSKYKQIVEQLQK
jgi:hypothetical protein